MTRKFLVQTHIKEILLDNSGGMKMMELIPTLFARLAPENICPTVEVLEEWINEMPEIGILEYLRPPLSRIKQFVYFKAN